MYDILNREVLDTLEMGKKAHSKSMFQDEWFTNKKFADWIGKTNELSEAQCLTRKKSIYIFLKWEFQPLIIMLKV